MRHNEEPIGVTTRDIKKDECIEIDIFPDGRMFSEAIVFFNGERKWKNVNQ